MLVAHRFVCRVLSFDLIPRISVANATMGLGAYWDLSAMCM